jgi:hypothetical protein
MKHEVSLADGLIGNFAHNFLDFAQASRQKNAGSKVKYW